MNAALIAPTQANVSALLARSLKPTLGMYADTKEKMTFLGAALTGVLLLSSTIAAFAFRPAGIPLWIASVATLICTFAAAIYNNRAPAHSPSRNRMFTLSKTLDNEASSRAPEVNHALATRPLPV